jgi:hypothetical protein
MLDRVDLLTVDEKVSAPDGIVYSTSPQTATTEDRRQFFIKGPDPEVVFAELTGCLLAAAVGLTVPPVAVCVFGDTVYCGSQRVADLGRNLMPWLTNPGTRVTNYPQLYAAIVVDVWLANEDRNLGNVVARSIGGGRVELVMIDFEKSAALRPSPLISSSSLEPKKLWPRNELGQVLRANRPVQPDPTMLKTISNLVSTEGSVAAIVEDVTTRFQAVEWSAGTVDTVIRRGRDIAKLAGEVWKL